MRSASLQKALALGYRCNEHLPLLDVHAVRDAAEVRQRLFSLQALVSCAYGFDALRAGDWLRREGLYEGLSERERGFLEGGASGSTKAELQWAVEALWVLAWSLGIHDKLDFANSCDDAFVHMLPDLKSAPSIQEFSRELVMRADTEVFAQADLAYCIHWAVRDAELRGAVPLGGLPPRAITERRRALEWLISSDPWDEVCLDT